MRQDVILITGAAGEIGHGLIDRLRETDAPPVVTLDLKPLEQDLAAKVERPMVGSILDQGLLENILAEYKVTTIYHLAALLSTRSEFTPVTAHQVNVEGTLNLLEFAQSEGRSHGERVRFFYPSSIAAYGLPGMKPTVGTEPVKEDEWNTPTTMYGCNKLACEHLGRYYAKHYRQLDAQEQRELVDFRSIRFPGLLSAVTTPSGGTSDFGPEMIHAAAKRESYACFVRPDARIPFMTMPDAVNAILQLMAAEASALTRQVYNIEAFHPSAEEFATIVKRSLPESDVSYEVDEKRMAIIDSWPAVVDDSAARNDWGFNPQHQIENAFDGYLIPEVVEYYANR